MTLTKMDALLEIIGPFAYFFGVYTDIKYVMTVDIVVAWFKPVIILTICLPQAYNIVDAYIDSNSRFGKKCCIYLLGNFFR
jgi:uncharacterized membrane protein YjgN (DUF898 family)